MVLGVLFSTALYQQTQTISATIRSGVNDGSVFALLRVDK
jgi:hypothetical protein